MNFQNFLPIFALYHLYFRMSAQAQILLQQIVRLEPTEMYWLYEELLLRLRKIQEVEQTLARVRGIGQGVWNLDAQVYINQLRHEDQ